MDLQKSILALVQQDIVTAEHLIDEMINALREYPGQASKEGRVASVAAFFTTRLEPGCLALSLAVAIERIAALEHFEADVPRSPAGS